ncbi:ABC transporter permease subunit [Paenibacillus rhizoplanae]
MDYLFFTDTLKETGWSAIIYIAAIAGIDPGLYEAAELDGANRWQRMWHITVQSIRPTIAILFILAVSGILGSNFEQIFMLKNNMNMKMAESLDLYIYNMGLVSGRHSFSTAVLFARSIVALGLLLLANQTSKKLTGDSIFNPTPPGKETTDSWQDAEVCGGLALLSLSTPC